jgi:hypothetical protein
LSFLLSLRCESLWFSGLAIRLSREVDSRSPNEIQASPGLVHQFSTARPSPKT